jgi:hypothetical protein
LWHDSHQFTAAAAAAAARDIQVPAVLVCHGTEDVSLPAAMVSASAVHLGKEPHLLCSAAHLLCCCHSSSCHLQTRCLVGYHDVWQSVLLQQAL